MRETVKKLRTENPDVQRAIKAMLARGLDAQFIDQEIGRALLGCLWEVNAGHPDRWIEVLSWLGEGTTTHLLFPDELYECETEGGAEAGAATDELLRRFAQKRRT
jgi:hypothetical protein